MPSSTDRKTLPSRLEVFKLKYSRFLLRCNFWWNFVFLPWQTGLVFSVNHLLETKNSASGWFYKNFHFLETKHLFILRLFKFWTICLLVLSFIRRLYWYISYIFIALMRDSWAVHQWTCLRSTMKHKDFLRYFPHFASTVRRDNANS